MASGNLDVPHSQLKSKSKWKVEPYVIIPFYLKIKIEMDLPIKQCRVNRTVKIAAIIKGEQANSET